MNAYSHYTRYEMNERTTSTNEAGGRFSTEGPPFITGILRGVTDVVCHKVYTFVSFCEGQRSRIHRQQNTRNSLSTMR